MRRPPASVVASVLLVVLVSALLVAVLGPTRRVDPVLLGAFPGARISSAAHPHPRNALQPMVRRSPVPVLLVHGYAGAPSQLRRLGDRLTREGRAVVYVTLPERATGDIHRSAVSLAAQARALHVPEVDVVGFSLGGIAARQWLVLEDPEVRVRHLVMLATPNGGVRLPDDSGRPEQPHCRPENACGELAPRSAFLRELAAIPAAARRPAPGSPSRRERAAPPAAAGRPAWLSVGSTADRLVHPVSATELPGARNL